MIVNFSSLNINFERKNKKRKKQIAPNASFQHIQKTKTKIKRKEEVKKSQEKTPIIQQETIIAGYFPNINPPNKEFSFVDKYKNGVKLSDGKVLLRPINNKKDITITPDPANNNYRKKYIITIQDKATKERKVKILREEALLQEENFCAGIIERKEKDSFNIFYSTGGYCGCIIRSNSDECEKLMEREQIQF